MKIYQYEEVLENTLNFFGKDELAANVWLGKYCLKNSKGEFVENSPEMRFKSIAKELVRIDKELYNCSRYSEEIYYKALVERRIIPGGSNLYGIANPFSITSLSNCFVISGDKEDSYGSIFRNDEEIAQIAKRRGGVGNDVSHIRPNKMKVSNSAGTTSGLVAFCKRFSNTTREVGQNNRRGALMLSVHVLHPDIMDFATMKQDKTQVTGANVSVRVTNEFMRAVEDNKQVQLRFPVDIPPIELNDGEELITDDGKMYRMFPARTIWKTLVESNIQSAEPGILFWDTIIGESPADVYPGYKTESTNPCGEIPLCPYDSCRLLSINLTSYVTNPFTKDAEFNMVDYIRDISIATHMMDNIVDLEIEKIKQIIDKVKNDPESYATKFTELNLWKKVLEKAEGGRRIGISIIGHGDMCAMLGIKYGSDRSIAITEDLHKTLAEKSYYYSHILSKSRGTFKVFDADLEKENKYLIRIGKAGIPRRNIALLTIPPAGTLSLLANNQTSGIEPLFLPFYTRRRKLNDPDAKADFIDDVGDKWEEYNVLHPYFKLYIKTKDSFADPEKLTTEELQKHFEESPYYGATSQDMDARKKVALIAAAQRYIDHSISNTTNLPKGISYNEVSTLYMTAWKRGCKGLTIYVDGSRSGVLNSTETTSNEEFEYHDAPKRPKKLPCDVYQPTIAGEQYVVLVGLYNNKPYEVIAFKKNDTHIPNKISNGILYKQRSGLYHLLSVEGDVIVDDIVSKFDIPEWEFTTRLISTALRHGASIDFIVEQLNKSEGPIVHFTKVIARQLKRYITNVIVTEAPCPDCGESMRIEGGCATCHNCGYSACS
jgi:ribonucleoside-diphosphate reductase alpha chain